MSISLSAVEQVSVRVWRVLGLNPGKFTLQGTNTYLVGTGSSRLLIDTGETNRDDYASLLEKTLSQLGARISQIVITHWHHDHLGGLPTVLKNVCPGDPPTVYKLPLDNSDLHYPLRGGGEGVEGAVMPGDVEQQMTYLKDGHILSTDGATLKVVATPGHTRDHLSLWMEEEKALFTGDCILGEGSAVFEDLESYMVSLEKLRALCPRVLYPGHGPVVQDGQDKIEEYIAHRNSREKQVVDYLKCCTQPVTPFQVVEHIYKDVDRGLWMGAENNVLQNLHKLMNEGRVLKSTHPEPSGQHTWKLNSKL